jgi:hypothetical protein
VAKATSLYRVFIQRLYDSGIISLDHLYQADPGILKTLLPKTAVAGIEKWRQKYPAQAAPRENPASGNNPNPRIVFTGNSDKLKNEIMIDGHKIYLQGRLYSYLQKLWWEHIGHGGWVHKDTLDTGLNQAKYISRLRRILREHDIDIEIVSNCHGGYALEMGEKPIAANSS